MPQVILVGVDGREATPDAVALGAALADALGDELALLHVYPYDPLAASAALGAPAGAALQGEAEAIVNGAAQTAPAGARRLTAPDTSTVAGLHAHAVREHAEVLVVGSTHRGAVGRIALGTHTGRALHGAPCAVAVAPHGLAGADWSIRKIAVAFDGSPEALDALALARRLAAARGAELRLVAVVDTSRDGWELYEYRPDWRAQERLAQERAQHDLEAVAQPSEQIEVRVGDAVAEIVAVSGTVDLLVLGSRGYGPVRRVIVGSTSDRVTRRADCPVVVVPRGASSEPAGAAAEPAGGQVPAA